MAEGGQSAVLIEQFSGKSSGELHRRGAGDLFETAREIVTIIESDCFGNLFEIGDAGVEEFAGQFDLLAYPVMLGGLTELAGEEADEPVAAQTGNGGEGVVGRMFGTVVFEIKAYPLDAFVDCASRNENFRNPAQHRSQQGKYKHLTQVKSSTSPIQVNVLIEGGGELRPFRQPEEVGRRGEFSSEPEMEEKVLETPDAETGKFETGRDNPDFTRLDRVFNAVMDDYGAGGAVTVNAPEVDRPRFPVLLIPVESMSYNK